MILIKKKQKKQFGLSLDKLQSVDISQILDFVHLQ